MCLTRVVFFTEAGSFRGEKQAGMHGGSHVTWKCKHCFLELKTSQDTVGLLKKSVRGCQTRSIFAKKAFEFKLNST